MLKVVEQFQGGLVVSCQALPGEPLYGAHYMAGMARAAKMGGAFGIRANGPDDIRTIKLAVDLPVIGIHKVEYPGFDAYITPTRKEATEVYKAGADIIAIDATAQSRPEALEGLIRFIREELRCPVMADVATLEEGILAERLGCALVATTMSGYTSYSAKRNTLDWELLTGLVHRLKVPVVAEGNIHTPEEARSALERGAYFVVVGGAITRPQEITRRFVEEIQQCGRL